MDGSGGESDAQASEHVPNGTLDSLLAWINQNPYLWWTVWNYCL